MRGQSLNFDNLGETLGASRNAAKLGTQQFLTPREIAEALATPLPPWRGAILDLACGHGDLAAGACNASTETVLGCDIDPTASALPKGFTRDPYWKKQEIEESTVIADLQQLAGLLREVNFSCDLLVGNPPFSLKWKEGDSTLVFFKLMLSLTTSKGEGIMICNQATAARLISDLPEARRIWLWVMLPNFFPGTVQDMQIAVLYYANDHRPSTAAPCTKFLNIPSAHPAAIRAALMPFQRDRSYIRGGTIHSHFSARDPLPRWRTVADEWRRRKQAEIDGHAGWNIRLRPDGKLTAWLTPFQAISGKVPKQLVAELEALNDEHHHLLSELVAYFVIPDVPDAPTLNPLKYKANLARLRALEN